MTRFAHKNRVGFTLIELLSVIAIIGVLIALFLPAVMSARGAMRRAQCANNLKQIGLAMQSYHDNQSSLPPGSKSMVFGTWQLFLYPYMEQEALYNSWNMVVPTVGDSLPFWFYGVAQATAVGTRVSTFMCPAYTGELTYTEALTGVPVVRGSYVANYGNSDIERSVNFVGAPFGDILGVGPIPKSSTCTLAEIIDGTSNTMLVSETITGRTVGVRQDLRGVTWNGETGAYTSSLGPNSKDPDNVGTCPSATVGYNDPPCRITPARVNLTDPGHFLAARSRHPGGVNVLFADGHVKFVKDSISLATWRALSTTRGCEVISGDAY